MKYRQLVLIAVMLSVASIVLGAPKKECLERSQRSVCKILVQRGDKEAVGSGFLWQDTQTVLTALHVVAGAKSITLSFTLEDSTITTTGTVVKSLKSHDLALIKLQRAIEAEPLKAVADRVKPGSELTTIGFPRGSTVRLDTPSTVRQLNSYVSLGKIVPAELRRKMPTLPVLAWDSEVLNLTGALQPGNSGGPLLDETCSVAAVLSGGIPQGSGYLNWGIPVEKIKDLLASTEKPIKWVEGEDNFFSQSLPTPTVAEAEPIESKWGSFFLLGTRTLSQMRFGIEAWSKDDPLGLEQLIMWGMYAMPQQEILGLKYDIYQEPASGATVVVPTGLRLEFEDALLQGKTSHGRLTFKAGVFPSGGPNFANQDAMIFENRIMDGASFYQFDPRLTYMHPTMPIAMTRNLPDGRWIVRKGSALRSMGSFVPDRFLFETLSGRGNTFMGAVVYSSVLPLERQNAGDLQFMRDWVTAVLAVHCSGFNWTMQPVMPSSPTPWVFPPPK